jgi:integrase
MTRPAAPSYRLHKPTGLAVVRLNGKDFYLGQHGTKESRERYDRLLGEWLARGRQLTAPASPSAGGITIAELIAAYWTHAEAYYRKPDGTPTSEPAAIRHALRVLRRLYARTPAAEFGPLKLQALREEMIALGWARGTINKHVQRVVRMFKWCTNREMIPPHLHQALTTVDGLRAGRSAAKETAPVEPIADAHVAAVLPHVCPAVAAMIRLQRVTGMRSGEVVIMQRMDLDTAGPVWIYRPTSHKTEHHGHARVIHLGPDAQAILEPFLSIETPIHAFLFSPAAEASRGTRRGRGGQRRRGPGTRYTVGSYRRAIARACDDAFSLPPDLERDALAVAECVRECWKVHKRPPRLEEMPAGIREARERVEAWRAPLRWHPHQLRHTAATELRSRFGIEAARVVLGHRSSGATEIYAAQDQGKAAEIMAAVG